MTNTRIIPRVWVTKYALTNGILEYESAEQDKTAPHMIVVKCLGRMPQYFHGQDWHETKADAIDRAEEMRRAKIAALRKQIAKLEAMTFGEDGE